MKNLTMTNVCQWDTQELTLKNPGLWDRSVNKLFLDEGVRLKLLLQLLSYEPLRGELDIWPALYLTEFGTACGLDIAFDPTKRPKIGGETWLYK